MASSQKSNSGLQCLVLFVARVGMDAWSTGHTVGCSKAVTCAAMLCHDASCWASPEDVLVAVDLQGPTQHSQRAVSKQPKPAYSQDTVHALLPPVCLPASN